MLSNPDNDFRPIHTHCATVAVFLFTDSLITTFIYTKDNLK